MARRRGGIAPLVSIVVIAAGMLALVLVEGWSPALGLDLQGGASVVYQAEQRGARRGPRRRHRDHPLPRRRPRRRRARDRPPGRLHRREPPGHRRPRPGPRRDRPHRRAPVPAGAHRPAVPHARSRSTPPRRPPPRPRATTTTTLPGDAPTTTAPGDTTSTTEGAAPLVLPAGLAAGEYAAALPVQDPSSTTTPPSTDTSAPTDTTATTRPLDSDGPGRARSRPCPATRPPIDGCIALDGTTPDRGGPRRGHRRAAGRPRRTTASPTSATSSGPCPRWATAPCSARWCPDPRRRSPRVSGASRLSIKGDDLPLFNQVATQCFEATRDPSVCPTGQLGIVLDGEVQSAPARSSSRSSAATASPSPAASPSARPATSPWSCASAPCPSSSRPRRCRRCRPPSARTRSTPAWSPAPSASPSCCSTCCSTTGPSAWW